MMTSCPASKSVPWTRWFCHHFAVFSVAIPRFSTDWNRPAVRPFDRNDFRYGHATHGYLPEKGPQPTFMAVGPSFRENVWLDSAAMIDEAPTFAALLGVPLPAADGKILQELLR